MFEATQKDMSILILSVWASFPGKSPPIFPW